MITLMMAQLQLNGVPPQKPKTRAARALRVGVYLRARADCWYYRTRRDDAVKAKWRAMIDAAQTFQSKELAQ
jgi:hypothetical protein